jgi:PadR family transcriptional regulator, regulatory protein PadR
MAVVPLSITDQPCIANAVDGAHLLYILEQMASRAGLGPVELMALLAVLQLGDDAYGVPIADAISEATGRDVLLGSVYVTLERLEQRGLLTSRVGDPTAERGGRAKRYFRVTAKGVKEARATQYAIARLSRGVRHLKGEPA